MANALKLFNLMKESGYPVKEILDIYALFNGIKETLEPLAFLNCGLAELGYPILEEVALKEAHDVREAILEKRPDALFLFSWNYTVAALFATGIQKQCPIASKLYVSHPHEDLLAPLYEPSTLLVTEALLANEKGIQAGIPPWKMILLPNHTSKNFGSTPSKRTYVEDLIAKSGKKITLKKTTKIIGSVARLDFGKNIEFALEAVKELSESGEDVLYVLKGDFEEETSYPAYRDWLRELLHGLKGEKWLLWDPSVSPFSELSTIYASFDIFCHLSGKEAGSNVVVEAVSQGKPAVILDATTNPSLFRNGAVFVKNDGTPPVDIVRPFALPCKKDLIKQLASLIQNESLLSEWGRKGKEMAEKRFSPEVTLNRMPLILRALQAYHTKSRDCDVVKKEVEELYHQDLRRYA